MAKRPPPRIGRLAPCEETRPVVCSRATRRRKSACVTLKVHCSATVFSCMRQGPETDKYSSLKANDFAVLLCGDLILRRRGCTGGAWHLLCCIIMVGKYPGQISMRTPKYSFNNSFRQMHFLANLNDRELILYALNSTWICLIFTERFQFHDVALH